MRDMSNIAKANYLAITLKAEAGLAKVEFDKHIERYKDNLHACMEWGTTLFAAAAYNQLFAVLADICSYRGEHDARDPNRDVTIEDIKGYVTSQWSYLSVVPSSSSAAHNVMKA